MQCSNKACRHPLPLLEDANTLCSACKADSGTEIHTAKSIVADLENRLSSLEGDSASLANENCQKLRRILKAAESVLHPTNMTMGIAHKKLAERYARDTNADLSSAHFMASLGSRM